MSLKEIKLILASGNKHLLIKSCVTLRTYLQNTEWVLPFDFAKLAKITLHPHT